MAGGGSASPAQPQVQRGNPYTAGGPGRTYFQQNPDVGAAYAQNSMGMSPTDFAQQHYQQYGQYENRYDPSQQFYQPVYQPQYQNYNVGNPMSVSQYGQGFGGGYGGGYGGMGGYGMSMQTPFNPYTNSFQTPFSYMQGQPMQQPQMQRPQTNYGPSQQIVSRSSSMRGTPNVMMRRAEGGIASLVDDE